MKQGSKVTWTSSSAGVTKTKQGVVIEVVPPKTTPRMAAIADRNDAKCAYGGGLSRSKESYVVLVAGETPRHKPTVYWPLVNALKEVA
jgi:hypothetical protein